MIVCPPNLCVGEVYVLDGITWVDYTNKLSVGWSSDFLHLIVIIHVMHC